MSNDFKIVTSTNISNLIENAGYPIYNASSILTESINIQNITPGDLLTYNGVEWINSPNQAPTGDTGPTGDAGQTG